MVELTAIAFCFFIVGAAIYGNLHFNSFGDDVFNSGNKKHGSFKNESLTRKKNKWYIILRYISIMTYQIMK